MVKPLLSKGRRPGKMIQVHLNIKNLDCEFMEGSWPLHFKNLVKSLTGTDLNNSLEGLKPERQVLCFTS